MELSSIEKWKAARFYPETYPGESPNSSYLLYDNMIQPISYQSENGFQTFVSEENSMSLNEFLSQNKLSVLQDRYPVVAYAANRNPATISIKLQNYKYKTLREKAVIPMLRGILKNADVVASGIHGQGYFYGDLLLNSELVDGCTIEVYVSLLDKDQLRVMNDSEGLKSNLYSLAWIDGVYLADTMQKLRSLVYISNAQILMLNSNPVAFSLVKAKNRRIPALSSLEIMEEFLNTLMLRQEVSKITGIPINSDFASELMKYLNGQWWYHFNTNNSPLKGFQRILEMFKGIICSNSFECNTSTHLRELNQLIPLEKAYILESDFTFAKMIKS